jgi:putative aminopeptidase FrvX
MVASVFGDNRNGIALALQRLSFHEFSGVDAWGALVVRTIQNEVGVAAVAAVAWVLAEFLKPRA